MDLFQQIAVRGRNNAHIYLDGRSSANFVKLSFLQDAQQFNLKVQGHRRDLVEEESPVICLLKSSNPVLVSACESPLYVAEKLVFQQRAGNGPAVHADKRQVFSRSIVMNSSGNQLFPGSGLSTDENRAGLLCDHRHDAVDLLHRLTLANQT